jgi:hypothetical protein
VTNPADLLVANLLRGSHEPEEVARAGLMAGVLLARYAPDWAARYFSEQIAAEVSANCMAQEAAAERLGVPRVFLGERVTPESMEAEARSIIMAMTNRAALFNTVEEILSHAGGDADHAGQSAGDRGNA